MSYEKKTISRITKLKTYLEAYLNNSDEIQTLEGIEFCENWLSVLVKNNKSENAISDLKLQVNSLRDDIHALEEIKYEFSKWIIQLEN